MALLGEHASRTRSLILVTGVVSTLMVWTSLYDPINLPKMFVLSCFSAFILGTVVLHLFRTKAKEMPVGLWGVLSFAIGLLVAAMLTDVKYTAFFGASQRSNGALSYFFLAVLCLAAMMSFDASNLSRMRIALICLGIVLTVYGLLQTTGRDPFNWVLLYGPVIGTVGNPDFMSSILSICAIGALWVLFAVDNRRMQMASGVFVILELYVIKKSGSFQGLVAFTVGLAILLLIWLWQKNRKIALSACLVAGIIAVFSLAGFANKGPLASLLFRSSMRNRLDYWHAAIGMFNSHPLFGVGLDRFGEYYGLFAPKIQVTRGQITNNAHNVFLQLFATGGLLVILPYLFLLGAILVSAIKAMKASTGRTQMDLAGLFSIWFSLLLISAISIDNIGVTVWFWISGGMLYAVSHGLKDSTKQETSKQRKLSKGRQRRETSTTVFLAPVISTLLTVLVAVIMVPVWRTSNALADLQTNRKHLSPTRYLQELQRVSTAWPKNPQTVFYASDLGMRIQKPGVALTFAKEVIAMDPMTNIGRQMAAIALENQKRFGAAIPFRVELVKLDPWNTANMVQLVKDYLGADDRVRAMKVARDIATLYPDSDDAKTAAALVKG